jgi:tetratricopeptide (TPR) repeat protein
MSDALLWNEIGNIYLKLGSPEDAIAAYTKAIELNPESGWLYCSLGHAYYLKGEFGRALFLFRKSIQLMDKPENQAEVWNKIGDAYRALKDIENAIHAYKKADNLDMRASLSEPNASRKPVNLDNIPETIKVEKNIPERNSPSTASPNITMDSERSVKSTELADDFLTSNIGEGDEENQPPPGLPETNLTAIKMQSEITDQEITASLISYEQELSFPHSEADNPPFRRKEPGIVNLDSNLITENINNEGQPLHKPEQIRKSDKATKQDDIREEKPKSSCKKYPGIDNLEEILAKVNIYENITRVNPTNDRAWDTLGKLYKSLSRYKDAIGAYQKAIEMAPDREVYYYYLGLLYSVEQQHDYAVIAFQNVLRINPDYVLAHSALAGVYHRMGLENKANHHIATALPKMNNESTYNRACFYAICGDTELAFEFLRLALINKDTTIEWIKSDPDLDPIRNDQRYQEMISEKDRPVGENNSENYYSSELEGTHNRLLPLLNNSLAR